MTDSNSTIVPFRFEAVNIRTVIGDDGTPLFIAKDIAVALGYSWQPGLVGSVPDKWKGINPINTPGGVQDMIVLTEQGVYFFVARSDKPKALPFQEWIAGEVLPSIRRDGGYLDPGASKKQLKQLEARIRSKLVRNEFTDTLKAHGVTGAGYAMCTDAINEPLLGGTAKMVKKARGLVVRDNLRDHLSMNELSAIMLAEGVSQERIEVKQVTGNQPCADECGTVAQAIARAIK